MAVPPLAASQRASAERAVRDNLAYAALDTAEDPVKAFSANLISTLAKRNDGEAELEGMGFFLQVTNPRKFKDLESAFRIINLDDDSEAPITGHLFIVGTSANGGYAIPVQGQTACLKILEDNGLGDRPFATFNAATGLVRFYTEGVDNEQVQVNTLLTAPRATLTLNDVVEVVSFVHGAGLCTPQLTNPGFWEDSDNWIPCSQAEKNIQWPLKLALATAFRPHVLVEDESKDAVGDADFAFYSANGPRNAPPIAIVETKVQKSFRTNGDVPPNETAKEFVRGIIQTAAYTKAHKASWGALLCFDLRKPDAGGEVAWTNARARGERVLKGLARADRGGPPEVVSWLVFANTEDAQAAQASGPLLTNDALYPVTRRPHFLENLQEATAA